MRHIMAFLGIFRNKEILNIVVRGTLFILLRRLSYIDNGNQESSQASLNVHQFAAMATKNGLKHYGIGL
jgi:hypothetical protein